MDTTELPIIAFENSHKWRAWLEKNHEKQGIWLRFFKKNSSVATISYDEAVDEALCFGWIDSQVKRYDEKSYLQKFTPRRTKSIWSKINREKIAHLTKEGRMHPAGIKHVKQAKQNGQWDTAYDSPSTMQIPDDFLKELAKNKKAKAFFETLNKTNTYAISWRLQTAKTPETRDRRMKAILETLAKGEKFHE